MRYTFNQIRENLNVTYSDCIEDTYIIKVELFNMTFYIECQTGMGHNMKETYKLTCQNDSGSDFWESGLENYLEDLCDDDEDFEDIRDYVISCIEREADSMLPGNTPYDYFDVKESIKIGKNIDCFGASYPPDVSVNVKKIINDINKYCVLYFEDDYEPKIENAIVTYKIFESIEQWNNFIHDVYDGTIDGSNYHVSYGDITASNRAYEAVINSGGV